MQDSQRYEEVVQCLAVYGYDVIPDGSGYIVRRGQNHEDTSRARHLEDLEEFAELFEWAAQRALARNCQ